MPNVLPTSNDIISSYESQLSGAGFDIEDPFMAAMVAPTIDALRTTNDRLSAFYNRSILIHATGADLDEKAAEFGIIRGSSVIAYDDTYTNFHISIVTGKAKDYTIDINSPLVIPASAINLGLSTSGIQFVVSEDIIIAPDSYTGYSPISATTVSTVDISANTITSCSINTSLVQNLDQIKSSGLQFTCTNNRAIASTSAINTDDQVIEACILKVQAMNNTNEDAVRLALYGYGIRDITFKRNMFGFGTLGVLVKVNGSANVSETTLTSINNILTNICPFARVVLPELLVTRFTMSVIYNDSTLIISTKQLILTTVQEYFNTRDLGLPLVPDEIVTRISSITNVKACTIQCMLIDDRPCIRTRQNALPDQLFVLSDTDPIIYVA